jgi:hypothetical protein
MGIPEPSAKFEEEKVNHLQVMALDLPHDIDLLKLAEV